MTIASGWSGCVHRLVEVLGFQGMPVRRVVLVFDPGEPIKAYVERFLHEEEVDGVTDIVEVAQAAQPGQVVVHQVEHLDVDEKGNISTR